MAFVEYYESYATGENACPHDRVNCQVAQGRSQGRFPGVPDPPPPLAPRNPPLLTYLRSTMSSERESGLALMNINYHRDINIEEVINTFAQRQPRRLLFA